jgi:hypothetical protein
MEANPKNEHDPFRFLATFIFIFLVFGTFFATKYMIWDGSKPVPLEELRKLEGCERGKAEAALTDAEVPLSTNDIYRIAGECKKIAKENAEKAAIEKQINEQVSELKGNPASAR